MNSRFSFQENQYTGECLPCTPEVFNRLVDDPQVAWRIKTRRAVDEAISQGKCMDSMVGSRHFQSFCERETKRGGKNGKFQQLNVEQKLQQWTNHLKMGLPCFIFGVKNFAQVPKQGVDGQQVLFRRRCLEGIEQLSGLFMFDADHLTCDPREVYEKTLAEGFPWQVRLGHKTSSGWGLRLVCEARLELGNIADNQIELARDLGLLGMKGSTGKPVTDNSCIDATRLSYCPMREDIYFMDKENLFNN